MVITDFILNLFEDQQGYVYSPAKRLVHVRWLPKFYLWPDEKEGLLDHLGHYEDREVYLSPALFTEPRINPSTFKGTRYVWAEFDGQVPENPDFAPTIRVQSSLPGHEHWYWRLDHFVTNKDLIESISKKLTYHYEADLSGWDYQQVLRPPNTFNHKRKKEVILLSSNEFTYALEHFNTLPEAPATAHTTINKLKLPKLTLLLAKYKWTPDALELMHKDVKAGYRSDAMARLAFECIEMGMDNEEVFVILDDADKRWNKFTGRDDRDKRLAGLISHTRAVKVQQYEIVKKDIVVFGFKDFMETDVKLEWILEGVLPVSGSAVIFGKGGIGKSTFSLRMAIAIALGQKDFLGWNITRRVKVMFTSLEMQHDELKQFFTDMSLSAEEIAELQDWFKIWPIGHAYPFDTPDQQIEILKQIDQHEIGLVIIDSHALAMYGSITDDDAVKRLNSFLNEDVRKARGCGYFFIHHPKKALLDGNKKGPDQDDAFGSVYIGYNAQTVMYLSSPSPGSNRVKLEFLKHRLVEKKDATLILERQSDRSFEILDTNKKGVVEKKVKESGGGFPGFNKITDKEDI